MNKRELFASGSQVAAQFCVLNSLLLPAIVESDEPRRYNTCAYYRANVTTICVGACASIGVGGPAWSYPGYVVDRTPYGVLQHELGHHVDVTRSTRRGNYYGDFGVRIREHSGEERITSYCPDDAEWFAEMFRVFVTNPDLLRCVRPRTYRELSAVFHPLFTDTWRDRIKDAPARTIAAAEKRVEAARANADLFAGGAQ
jgi:hypothetical protein